MKNIEINDYPTYTHLTKYLSYTYNKLILLLYIINTFFILYLLIQNKRFNSLINELSIKNNKNKEE